MAFPPRMGSIDRLLENSAVLGDILAQDGNAAFALQNGLRYLLTASGRSAGMIVVKSAEAATPTQIIAHNCPPEWENYTHQADSVFFQVAAENLAQHSDCWFDPTLKTMVVTLPSDSCIEGFLVCAGDESDCESTETIRALAPVLGKAIRRIENRIPVTDQQVAMAALTVMASTLESRQSTTDTQVMMIKSLCSILKAESSMLVILDEDQAEFAEITCFDATTGKVHQESRPIEDGLVTNCLHNERVILDNQAEQNGCLNRRFDTPGGVNVRNLLCCPLNASDNTLGAILVFNKLEGGFNPLDQELMTSMATALANTAYNLRLIQQLKLANADLEASRWELLRSRNTLRALFDNIPSSIYIVDRRYTLIAINMSRADRASSKPNLMVGRKCHQVLYGRSEPCPGCRVTDTLFSGQSTSRVDRSWINNDQFMEWDINTYPIYDATSQPIQAIVVEQDITEKRRLEVSLAQSEKLAAVGQLAAGVAHEINNPLAAIIANAQILERDLPKDNDLQESVKLIQLAGSRASQVVRNLLGFARKENYDFTPIDLNETIRSALMLLQHEFVSRPVDLIFDLADDLPRIVASREHLQGVWINLMLNAFDALEGMPGEVRITTRKQGNEFRITIADTGKGIPPDRVSRIFEPFYTTKEAGRGTGLGLSLCHRTVKQHGGYILVESQVGVGTKFIVVLPVGSDQANEQKTGD